jgi:hypothetical protein
VDTGRTPACPLLDCEKSVTFVTVSVYLIAEESTP